MQLVIHRSGLVQCLYDEAIDLTKLGQVSIRRGSYVEPDRQGKWHCDLAPVAGPVLGPFRTRSGALAAEVEWLSERWLLQQH